MSCRSGIRFPDPRNESEINTIGSKSNAIEIKNQVVQSKTILEKSENKYKILNDERGRDNEIL